MLPRFLIHQGIRKSNYLNFLINKMLVGRLEIKLLSHESGSEHHGLTIPMSLAGSVLAAWRLPRSTGAAAVAAMRCAHMPPQQPLRGAVPTCRCRTRAMCCRDLVVTRRRNCCSRTDVGYWRRLRLQRPCAGCSRSLRRGHADAGRGCGCRAL